MTSCPLGDSDASIAQEETSTVPLSRTEDALISSDGSVIGDTWMTDIFADARGSENMWDAAATNRSPAAELFLSPWNTQSMEETLLGCNDCIGPWIMDAEIPGPSRAFCNANEDQTTLDDQGAAINSLAAASTTNPNQISDPANKKDARARQRVSEEDWNRHRPLITRLYAEKTLSEVMRDLEKEHDFKAT